MKAGHIAQRALPLLRLVLVSADAPALVLGLPVGHEGHAGIGLRFLLVARIDTVLLQREAVGARLVARLVQTDLSANSIIARLPSGAVNRKPQMRPPVSRTIRYRPPVSAWAPGGWVLTWVLFSGTLASPTYIPGRVPRATAGVLPSRIIWECGSRVW